MTTIFDLLEEDHQHVDKLLKRIGSSKNDASKRSALLEEVYQDLEKHMHFEEAEVYPAIQKAMGEEGELKHAVKEHREARQLLKALRKTIDKGDEGWIGQLKELQAAIKHHVSEEEDELFPQAREKVAKTKAEKLASQYRASKKLAAAE
ncbi:MAG: hemerythrin domain-containing protein [Rhodospirillales bacterium]